MKKSLFIKAIPILSAAAILVFASSCSDGSSSEQEKKEIESGKASVTMFVPDYDALSSTSSVRVVAPQTKSVKFGYSDGTEFTYLDVVDLSSAEKSPVSEEASAAGVSGFNYTLTFSGIPVGFYNEKTLEVQLLDSNGNAISKGTNDKSVEVVSGGEAEASFYTIPVSSDAESGSLEKGEMKFLKISLSLSQSAKISLSVSESVFPDIVVFAADGTFVKYVDVSIENSSFEIEAAETSVKYYLGVWAGEEEVPSYKIDVEKSSDSEESESETSSVKAVIDAGSGYSCPKCGKHYDTQEEATSCATEKNCSESEDDKSQSEVELGFIEAGSYDLSVSAGFTKQGANESTQVVNNIAISAKIEENYAVLNLKSKVQAGTIKFKLSKPMTLLVTETTSGRQTKLYGVSIVSSDGTATYEGETVSLPEIPTQKKGTDVANKTLSLTAGTYELCAHSASSLTKVSNLIFAEINN